MKIFVLQFYIEAGAKYAFSLDFQRYIHLALSQRVHTSTFFLSQYGDEFTLIFRMSAKSSLRAPDVKGPTVFRKDKDVEYSIFLPFDKDRPHGPDMYRLALERLFESIVNVLKELKIDSEKLTRDQDVIIDTIMSDPKMFDPSVVM